MDEVLCGRCKQHLSFKQTDSRRQPCPYCGATNRIFNKGVGGTLNLSGDLTGIALRNNRPIGFVESGTPNLTRHTTFTPDRNIILNLRGLSPKNEDDSDLVCQLLVTAFNENESKAVLSGKGKQDEDCILEINGIRRGVQVVRALTDSGFWKDFARRGEVNNLQLTIADATSALRTAIEHKTSIPEQQRSDLILLLDAYRLPALALGPVIDQFKNEQIDWARGLGFYAIYIVGPTAKFVSRLDK